MTEQEAIDVLKNIGKHCKANDLDDEDDVVFDSDFVAAWEMSMAALEKQIPKKPNKAIDKSWGIEKEAYVCPICDYFLPKIYFIPIGDREYSAGKKTTYCETCGQKIDWD